MQFLPALSLHNNCLTLKESMSIWTKDLKLPWTSSMNQSHLQVKLDKASISKSRHLLSLPIVEILDQPTSVSLEWTVAGTFHIGQMIATWTPCLSADLELVKLTISRKIAELFGERNGEIYPWVLKSTTSGPRMIPPISVYAQINGTSIPMKLTP